MRIAPQPAVRYAVGLQSIQHGETQLQRMKAKYIGHRSV